MPSSIKIITDALNPIPQSFIRKNYISILPRYIQIGQKRVLLDQTTLITNQEVEQFLAAREGKVLPFDSDLALSAIRKNTTDKDTILVVLPPKALDSIYEKIIVTKGLLKGQRSIEVVQTATFGIGLKTYTEAVSDFAAGESLPEVTKAFAERVLAGIHTVVMTKGKLPEDFVKTPPKGIMGVMSAIFGSTSFFQINSAGTVQEISKGELLSFQDDDRELWIEYSRGSEKFIQRFLKENPELQSRISALPLKPERLSLTKQVILFHFLPTQDKVNKIAAWARHWGQLTD